MEFLFRSFADTDLEEYRAWLPMKNSAAASPIPTTSGSNMSAIRRMPAGRFSTPRKSSLPWYRWIARKPPAISISISPSVPICAATASAQRCCADSLKDRATLTRSSRAASHPTTKRLARLSTVAAFPYCLIRMRMDSFGRFGCRPPTCELMCIKVAFSSSGSSPACSGVSTFAPTKRRASGFQPSRPQRPEP